MKLQLVRHATLLVSIRDKTLLVDPMLSPKGALPPIANSPNPAANPLVPLPEAVSVAGVDAILVTHTHPDHFDEAAMEILSKQLPVFCQPEDEAKLLESGFQQVSPIHHRLEWKGLTFDRTGGQHGTGVIGEKMGPVSGFVLQSAEEPILYIAGDTIWCPEVKEALDRYRPQVAVVNAGGARFLEGDPITMTAEDVEAVCRHAPETRVIAVHMEAINHCLLTREELSRSLNQAGLRKQVVIPGDGEVLTL
ncbi:MBL fold metallo-hydrolase [Brevibacillus humidisoli]|uniref:MBL fold metallo-hydrolase n=1 Tax=Brevibacillus humidisoli TaxID=2895522 RepID=UPI001E4E8C7E|nr:MBL fold metallo-hydrolase [Brevibacillus humidisoli]UFJ42221.1 MBL fold metallo-hydrolase [Brevibacillus humidisoli]